ncbi:MAG: GLPGLI family protein [Nonlabens sp.]|jgi:GLPGLI family protein|uniref:GLPGLI family protein n=1 Tax=Nonlabens sp. TaxID=1888209 RepID=UPI0039E4980C
MKTIILLFSVVASLIILPKNTSPIDDFQGQAVYISKTRMDLGSWGARMSEEQKKQMQSRLKNRLEKTYVLNFNKEESIFDEKEKLDAMSGATDSWGNNFAAGEQYKNVKKQEMVQSQEFYGKQFLVKDKLAAMEWQMGSETKQIGKYTCFKATATIPNSELTWYSFSWNEISTDTQEKREEKEAAVDGVTATTEVIEIAEIPSTKVEAWYTLQIPVGHGPAEYWGLPGLILEVSAGDTTMLCTKIVMNPKEKIEIEAPDKGKEITKVSYKETIVGKMMEMRNNRGRRRG